MDLARSRADVLAPGGLGAEFLEDGTRDYKRLRWHSITVKA
jgi:hypothetical protein